MELNIIHIILIVVIALLQIVGLWKIFSKAGKAGWKSLIPIYNIIVWLQIIGKPWWWMLLLLFVPIADIIIMILMYHGLSKSFGKGAGFTVGLVLLGFIFVPILGFGRAQYIGPGGAPKTA
ncbi:MAG: signal peptidase I [Candidatus Latescibacteria bacterium]|nr:signal peptidase I [Candidatus Latescibacterota bacterium]